MADPYASVTPERQRRLMIARKLRGEGRTHREIADVMGLRRSIVSDLLNDPENTKKRARRIAYGGACIRCGGLTDGSGGHGPSPEFCLKCRGDAQHDERYWTRARVADAFREFNRRVGRAPTAADVMVRYGAPSMEAKFSTARVAEIMAIPDDLRMPVPFVVAREFGSWHNALRMAGLPPNSTGGAAHRTAHRTKKGATMMRQFVVFSKNGSGWIPCNTVEAVNSTDAIQRIADQEGVYVAVPAQHWAERTVAPKTVFAVVEDA